MAKGHWVAHIDVDDFDGYNGYVAANTAPFAEYGAKVLVRGGARAEPQGKACARTVVIEFPSYEQVLACYESDGYQPAKALRDPVSTGDLVIIQGHDG